MAFRFLPLAWLKRDKDSVFRLHVREFIAISAIPLMLALLLSGLYILRGTDVISGKTFVARSTYLPAILETHRVTLNLETLRRLALHVYLSDDPLSRREARISALSIGNDAALDDPNGFQPHLQNIFESITAIEQQRLVADEAHRKTEAEIVLLTDLVRAIHTADYVRDEVKSDLVGFNPFNMLGAIREATNQQELRKAQSLGLDAADTLGAALSRSYNPNIRDADIYRQAVMRVVDMRGRALLERERARLLWEDVDERLRSMRDQLNATSFDLAYSTLLSINAETERLDRGVFFSGALILLGLAMFLLLLRQFIIRPMMLTSNKLQHLRTGTDTPPIKPFHVEELNEVATLINFSSQQLSSLYQQTRDLEREKEEIEGIAITDALTGLNNRRYFDLKLKELRDDALKRGTPPSAIMLDIDHFKRYNDSLGHTAGDECLKRVAEAIRGSLYRKGDMVFRYGGEEFAALLPECPSDIAMVLAERIRSRIEGLGIIHPESSVSPVVTASLGVATLSPAYPVDGKTLIDMADAALYFAKSEGRNRVCSTSR